MGQRKWIECPLSVQEVMGSNPVGDSHSDFSLSHARVMLINSPFTLHYRTQNSPSLLIFIRGCFARTSVSGCNSEVTIQWGFALLIT